MEKKIDGIVSLLAANQRNGLSPLTPESPQEILPQTHHHHHHQQPHSHAHAHSHNEAVSINSAVSLPIDVITHSDIPVHFSGTLELFPGLRITHQQAAECINSYRRDYVPNFPFVPVPEHMTSHELFVESSLLFWTIVAVVSPLEDKVQMEFKLWFRKYLAEHLVVRQEKSVDVLQAMLIYLAW